MDKLSDSSSWVDVGPAIPRDCSGMEGVADLVKALRSVHPNSRGSVVVWLSEEGLQAAVFADDDDVVANLLRAQDGCVAAVAEALGTTVEGLPEDRECVDLVWNREKGHSRLDAAPWSVAVEVVTNLPPEGLRFGDRGVSWEVSVSGPYADEALVGQQFSYDSRNAAEWAALRMLVELSGTVRAAAEVSGGRRT